MIDYIFIKNGYSKQDIEAMSMEEYDCMFTLLVNKKANAPFGGI